MRRRIINGLSFNLVLGAGLSYASTPTDDGQGPVHHDDVAVFSERPPGPQQILHVGIGERFKKVIAPLSIRVV
jgi:hypothetical protein